MNAIADKLTVEDYDIVCLQEVWSNEDYKMIKGKTREQLRYSYYFFSGVFGSGVCIFSRYPIDDVIFHKWPLNGYVHKITHGDWFGGKGVGLFKLKVCNINVNVYIAHVSINIFFFFNESNTILIVYGFFFFFLKVARRVLQGKRRVLCSQSPAGV